MAKEGGLDMILWLSAWILTSVVVVLAIERFKVTRPLLKSITPAQQFNSFLLDIPILLPLVGLLVELVVKKTKANRLVLYLFAILTFWSISASLYFDKLSFAILTPLLGHPDAWNGNHFMWNSGAEILGLKPFVDTTIPTYNNFLGAWNIFALILFAIYPVIMVVAGVRLYGILFGYSDKQTGIMPLFWESLKKK